MRTLSTRSGQRNTGPLPRQVKLTGVGLVAFLTAWPLCFAFLILSPAGKPTFEIAAASSDAGFSQIFVGQESNGFSEQASTWAPMVEGDANLRFGLRSWRGTVGEFIRWDPLDRPAKMVVKQIQLKTGLVAEEIELERVRPSMAVVTQQTADGDLVLVLESNDPQVLFEADVAAFIERSNKLSALVAGVIAGVVAVCCVVVFQQRIAVRRLWNGLPAPLGAPSQIKVPRWAVLIFGFLAASGTTLLILGSKVIGVSWDEPTHESSLGEYFRSGIYAPRWSFADGAPSDVAAFVYAPVADLLGHTLGAALGVHDWFAESYTSESYFARHVTVAALTILGIIAVGLTVKTVLDSWKWALVGVATMFALPLFIGHGMFNIKDAPLAVGFSVFSLGLTMLVTRLSRPSDSVISATALGLGLVLALGSRPGIWLALALSVVLVLTLSSLLRLRQERGGAVVALLAHQLTAVIIATIGAWLILWLIYPAAFGQPGNLLVNSVAVSQAFPWTGTTLTAGLPLSGQPPWFYIPLWLGAQVPVVVLALVVVGVVAVVIGYIRAWKGNRSVTRGDIGWLPAIFQAFGVPVAAVLLGSSLYGGLRQLLFVFPALAILAVVGLSWTARLISRTPKSLYWRGLWLIAIVGLSVPLFAQVRLFPYSFAYFNAAASLGDLEEQWEIDGWWLSGRELVADRQLPKRTVCVESQDRPIAECARLGMVSPFLGDSVFDDFPLAEDEYVALSRFGTPPSGDECVPTGGVVRPALLQTIKLSTADLCKVSLQSYPDRGLALPSASSDDPSLLWGWDEFLFWGWRPSIDRGVIMENADASLGFSMADSDLNALKEIRLAGRGVEAQPVANPVSIHVNGVEVGQISIPPESQEWSGVFPVPAEAWTALGDSRVVVRLSVEDGDSQEPPMLVGPESLAVLQLAEVEVR